MRGAYYKISTMSSDEREKGLITASAGNHAQGVAYAAKLYGVPATIVMPTTTPLIKVNRTKGYGANVVLHRSVYDEACQKALELAEKSGATFVHPFNDETVATGQGTIAMEIFKELPTVDIILVPIGGGGLAAGVSTLAKLLNPNIKVIGVEPAGASCMKASLDAGKVVTLPNVETIADGTAVKTPGDKIFPYIQKNIDEIIAVEDEELIVAISSDILENHKMLVENSGLLTVGSIKASRLQGQCLTVGLQSSRRKPMRLFHFLRLKDFQYHHRSVRLHQFRPCSRVRRQTADKIINPFDRHVPINTASILEYFGSRTQLAHYRHFLLRNRFHLTGNNGIHRLHNQTTAKHHQLIIRYY